MSLKIHHLNCGTMCPHGKRLIAGNGGWLEAAEMCCHCLLIEGPDGLVLVDTGLGTGDVTRPAQLGRMFNLVTRPQLRLDETALHQVQALGFKPSDVRDIVVTHLDLDHAGGLPDFPEARVHVFAPEKQAATQRLSAAERGRYRPAHFAHNPNWVVHETDGDQWFGFDSVRAVPGTGDGVLLIPLTGHSRGHSGVAVDTGDGWLLHCGDAYFHHDEMVPQDPHCPVGLRMFQNLVQMDGRARKDNQVRLRMLVRDHGDEVKLMCAHDPVELARFRALRPSLQDMSEKIAEPA